MTRGRLITLSVLQTIGIGALVVHVFREEQPVVDARPASPPAPQSRPALRRSSMKCGDSSAKSSLNSTIGQPAGRRFQAGRSMIPQTKVVNADRSGSAAGNMTTARFSKNKVEFIGCGLRRFEDPTQSFYIPKQGSSVSFETNTF